MQILLQHGYNPFPSKLMNSTSALDPSELEAWIFLVIRTREQKVETWASGKPEKSLRWILPIFGHSFNTKYSLQVK